MEGMTPAGIAALKKEILSSLRCVLPGTVVRFDPGTGTADVQPLVNLGGRLFPEMKGLPAYLPRGRSAAAGERCLVLVADYDLDAWAETGPAGIPPARRSHSLSDAVALIGFLRGGEDPGEITDLLTVRNDFSAPVLRFAGTGQAVHTGALEYGNTAGAGADYLPGRFCFYQFSPSADGSARLPFYEAYRLPQATAALESGMTYDILTSRAAVTVAQGGTGARTAAEARTNLGLGGAATCAVANNLTVTAAGSVLDARMGKTLNTSIGNVNTAVSNLNGEVNVTSAVSSPVSWDTACVKSQSATMYKCGKLRMLTVAFTGKTSVGSWQTIGTIAAANRPAAEINSAYVDVTAAAPAFKKARITTAGNVRIQGLTSGQTYEQTFVWLVS